MTRGGKRKGAVRPRMKKREKSVTVSFSLRGEEIALLTAGSKETLRSKCSIVGELIREGLPKKSLRERW